MSNFTINLKCDRTSSVKKMLTMGSLNLASSILVKMLSDENLLLNTLSPLFKYISDVKFDGSTRTANVDLKNKSITINPEFFLKNIEDIRDVLFLIMHEREHVINHIKYGKAETSFRIRKYSALKKVGLDERFLEDVYINFSLVRVFKNIKAGRRYVPLSVRFYRQKGKKNFLKNALLSGVLTPSVKKKVKDTWGDKALKMLENLSKKHVPLYYEFVHSFLPEVNEDKSPSSGYDDRAPLADSEDAMDGMDGMETAEVSGQGQTSKEKSIDDNDDNYDHDDNYDDYDYEDLTCGSEDYIFSNSDSRSKYSNDFYLVKVSDDVDELAMLATVFDGLLGGTIDRHEMVKQEQGFGEQVAYEVFNTIVKDIKHEGKLILPPHKLSRKDVFLLSSDVIPVLWDTSYSPEGIKFAVYYDVSFSMHKKYGLVYSLKKVLAPYIVKSYQFSGFMVQDESVPEGFFKTDGSTRIKKVLSNIVENRYKDVVIVSDFCDAFGREELELIDEMKTFVRNFVMIIVGNSTGTTVINHLKALDPLEIRVD